MEKSEKNYANYISTIRSLLNQKVSAYHDKDIISKKLVTPAFDNFEYLKRSIGNEMAENGEDIGEFN